MSHGVDKPSAITFGPPSSDPGRRTKIAEAGSVSARHAGEANCGADPRRGGVDAESASRSRWHGALKRIQLRRSPQLLEVKATGRNIARDDGVGNSAVRRGGSTPAEGTSGDRNYRRSMATLQQAPRPQCRPSQSKKDASASVAGARTHNAYTLTQCERGRERPNSTSSTRPVARARANSLRARAPRAQMRRDARRGPGMHAPSAGRCGLSTKQNTAGGLQKRSTPSAATASEWPRGRGSHPTSRGLRQQWRRAQSAWRRNCAAPCTLLRRRHALQSPASATGRRCASLRAWPTAQAQHTLRKPAQRARQRRAVPHRGGACAPVATTAERGPSAGRAAHPWEATEGARKAGAQVVRPHRADNGRPGRPGRSK